MYDHKNTTELNVMGDEAVTSEPVEHMHDYQDLDPFSLRAYSLAEIFGETLRTIYQRSRGRDYCDLYQIVVGDDTPSSETVASIFEETRVHAPAESYHTPPNPLMESLTTQRRPSQTTLPELVADVPPLETVRQRLDAHLTDTLAPALGE